MINRIPNMGTALIAGLAILLAGPLHAAGPPESGFFDDYSKLEPADAPWADFVYITDEWREVAANTTTFIIPQPELFLAPDSKYKGMKPDDMKIITDSMRQLFVEAFADDFQIAASPGPNTIMLRMAFSNLNLKKKPRIPVVGWLPPAYIASSAKRAFLNEFTDNILLTEVVWEAEMLDPQTGEIHGQIIVLLGDRSDKDQFTSWDELVTALAIGAKRLRCRFDNTRVSPAAQRDCYEITEADLELDE